eukprot:TRINITY_DN1581_c0_g1_i1.p2 TRINITY_DN1581_c0_g1~~TRINITY_DN1581_c0_g1_i1.p2  ORF type:complete len:279 (+),score=74.66 TRINITY_DN1581_c0_g1_i1:1144-1980(+)
MRISKLYPIIGLHSHGEKVQVNFGEKPFVFDIVSKINKEGGDNNMTVEIDDEEDFDWDLVEVNPLQPYYTRIKTDINAANDEVFVEDLRKFFPGEDIPIPELFQIVENWYIKEEIELGERKTLSIIPKDERPKEIVYSHENGVLQEILTLLLNDEINDEECMAQYDNEGVFGIAGHLLEEDDQEQDAKTRRDLLIQLCQRYMRKYIIITMKYDIAKLSNPEKFPDDSEEVVALVQTYQQEFGIDDRNVISLLLQGYLEHLERDTTDNNTEEENANTNE